MQYAVSSMQGRFVNRPWRGGKSEKAGLARKAGREMNEATAEFHRCLKKKGLVPDTFRLFRKIINRHYRKHGRHDLPWRMTGDPYRILVSEIMLQQTQVERVIDKYDQFLRAFPDIQSLALSSPGQVITVWKGLGYNRRAIALHKIAQSVVRQLNGTLPASPDALASLPGIGRATASSICAFAFNRPVVFIETNIRRVFIHFFFRDKQNVHDNEILPLVEKTLVRSNPRRWYSALMDYGAMMKKGIPNPNAKSVHYQKQSPFEGSRRQLRGRVLQAVIENSGISEARLARLLEEDPGKISGVLHSLRKEGFLKKRGRGLRFA
jgi:A/G-specific adenine glycosylase